MWPNPNLGTGAEDSYRGYDRLLTDLETSGLHELEAEWRDSLLKLSGNDLTGLHSELAAAVRCGDDRIRWLARRADIADEVTRILADMAAADCTCVGRGPGTAASG